VLALAHQNGNIICTFVEDLILKLSHTGNLFMVICFRKNREMLPMQKCIEYLKSGKTNLTSIDKCGVKFVNSYKGRWGTHENN
jgi:hypothetical protein